MSKKLSKAPVYYTVAQVQFNPILNLESFIPAIQARMREACFPDYRKEVVQQIILPFGLPEGGQAAQPAISPQLRYLFGDVDGRSLFVVEPNSISFQTTRYDTFKEFSKNMLNGLTILHDTLKLNFIERIGLRYLDAVQPSGASETLKDYLVAEVLGHALNGEGRLQHSVSETVSVVGGGQLVSRVLIRHGRLGLPSELSTLAPTIDPRFTQYEGLHGVIDTDASFNQRETFELGKIGERFITLHAEITKSFSSTVTDYARSVWV